MNQITEAFSQGNYSTLAIFNDLSKAFDTVNRGILQEKLKAYGIQSENGPCDLTNLLLNSIEKICVYFLNQMGRNSISQFSPPKFRHFAYQNGPKGRYHEKEF